jgi:hypothetical protein
MSSFQEKKSITNSAKRRMRKKNNNKKDTKDKKFYDELHSEAVKHYFTVNPSAVRIFGTDSIKFANFFADECVSSMRK